jgi:hypothetical protein
MAAILTRLTHKIAIQLHLVAESCTICNSRSRRPVRKLLDTLSYIITTCELDCEKKNYRFVSQTHKVNLSKLSLQLIHLLQFVMLIQLCFIKLAHDWGSIPGGRWKFFSSPPRPDRLWGPSSLLSNGYRVFHRR